MSKNYRRPARRGVTLFELLVVLLILVFLSAVLIPIIPSFLLQAHTATGASNIEESTRNLQIYQVRFGGYPDNMDNLMNEAGAAVNGNLPGGATSGAPVALVPLTLSADQAAQITGAGIDTVQNMADAPTHATFDYALGTTTAIADTVVVAGFNEDSTASTVGLPAGDYVAFGIGNNNSAIGRTMIEAPVHIPEEGAGALETEYNRFIAIFRLPDEGPAELAAVASLHEESVDGLGFAIEEYFEVSSD